MDKEAIGLISLGVLATATVIGIFVTKTKGWGKYSTSTLILTLALLISTLLLILGKVEASVFGNVLFAVVGYAGGLIVSKKVENED